MTDRKTRRHGEFPTLRVLILGMIAMGAVKVARGQGGIDPVDPGPTLAADLPEPLEGPTARPGLRIDPMVPSPAVPAGPSMALEPGMTLIPGQPIAPIDLPGALRLAGARDLDVAIARERVAEAVAELQLARSAWLPSLFIGPNWIRHDGAAQVVEGPVRQISKSSLFLGGTIAGGNGVTGPVPAGGPAPLGNLTTILRISDAIFQPLAARQVVEARRLGVEVANNDALLGVAEAYFDLQGAAGRLAISREAAGYATTLAEITASFARTGAGLEAEYRRSLVERDLRRRMVAEGVGDLEVASAELVRRTRLDPRVLVAPIEPPEAVIHLVSDASNADDLIVKALLNRPELAESRELVEATLIRLKQARLRPLIPSLAFRFSAGGFGGGSNAFFGNFDGRQDADVNLFWELQGLGLADRAIAKSRAAQNRVAKLELLKVQDQIAAEVVAADRRRIAADRQVALAGRAIPEAVTSLELNLSNIRRGAGLTDATRPIEVLQPIQALARAREEYLDAVLSYNRAQFRLFHAMGRPLDVQDRP